MCKRVLWMIWINCQRNAKDGRLVIEENCPRFRKGARRYGVNAWCLDFNGAEVMAPGYLYQAYRGFCDKAWKEGHETRRNDKPVPTRPSTPCPGTPHPDSQHQRSISRKSLDLAKASSRGHWRKPLASHSDSGVNTSRIDETRLLIPCRRRSHTRGT